MSVPVEDFEQFLIINNVLWPIKLHRNTNGQWRIEIAVNLEILLNDGTSRTISTGNRKISILAVQSGSKPRKRKALPAREKAGRLMELGDKG